MQQQRNDQTTLACPRYMIATMFMTMFVYTMTMFICSMTISVLYMTMFVYCMTMF
jgi:succinate-acetate transporter protein